MNKKRIFLTVLALVLVCALSIMGTVAYLTNTTETVTNTFVAAGGGQLIDPDGEDNDSESEEDNGFIKLQEHGVTKNDNGQYTLNGEVVQSNEYEIMPGMVIPKDPYITIQGKTETPAYLYVEVINGFGEDVVAADTLKIDIANWLKLDVEDREIYVYTAGGEKAAILTSDITDNLYIIEDNKFTINPELDPTTIPEAGQTLVFNAFLAQASIGEVTDPAEIFTTCFSTSTSAPETP